MPALSTDELRDFIRDIPDFPRKGILFKDIAPLLWSPAAFGSAIDHLAGLCPRAEAVVAIESRGFVFGAGLALAWKSAFVPARKFGKLPGRTVRQQYSLEYGEDVLELQADSLRKGQTTVVVDDLLATGGTAEATSRLIEQLDARVEALLFVVELHGLGGRDRLRGRRVESVVQFDLG